MTPILPSVQCTITYLTLNTQIFLVSTERIHWSLHHTIRASLDGKLVETIVGGIPEKGSWFLWLGQTIPLHF